MDALNYLKTKKRMTKNCRIDCDECLLGNKYNGRNINCFLLESLYSDEAIKIVEDWGKEHPLKTNKDKYKEIIRETFGDNFDIEICGSRPYENIPDCRCDSMMDCGDCVEFWNSEYIEKEKE